MRPNAGPAAIPVPVARSLANAAPRVYWLDRPDAAEPLPALTGNVTADLAIVGGGFTGLGTALPATERGPSLDVVRSAVIQLTRSSLARADRHDGRRDPWLRLLDRIGLGYDSQQGRVRAAARREPRPFAP